MCETIHRCHYRALLKAEGQENLGECLEACQQQIRTLIRAGRLMTAALYYHGRQLFLYFEAVGEEMQPACFMSALHPLLEGWPQKEEIGCWAKMYHIYWHDQPRDLADWRRPAAPEKRCGRIALLKQETMWRYAFHHIAIVEEGLLQGDRYQSIAMHEDMLFSYFEEPRTLTNIRRVPQTESEAIKGWLDVDPESHFLPLTEGQRGNFLMLPAYFALGEEAAD